VSRVRPVRVKGGWEKDVFSPIPIEILDGHDFTYGPTGTKFLSGVTSRHKLAWLWATVHEAVERDGGLVYHAALEMIEIQGQFLDAQKGEKEWPAILRGYRWERGIVLPGERKSAGQMTITHWMEERNMPSTQELLMTEEDFVLTAYDSLSCGGESEPPTWNALEIAAIEQDEREAVAAQVRTEQCILIGGSPPGGA